ncbi:hypothetical protein DPMN_142304 [Dreissena polymorpha]|uniref:Uncharacterized protein n=1 Tax=Dreissena polymorpha TaxID=45954 RepID=A0A9D4GB16_DREPO|nr:hypothetical protein DPMN_142304 [Dreissena polymorpha]
MIDPGGAPGLIMWPCIIDRIVIRDVQYQFEVNRCRNEEVIVKCNFRWAWSMWAGASQVEIYFIVIRDVQYQFEVNRCRNEEVISMWAGRPSIGHIVIRDVQYKFEVNRCRNEENNFQGGDNGQDRLTDGRTDGGDNHNIPTLFKKRGDEKIGLLDMTKQ